jgi:hypothetical protein
VIALLGQFFKDESMVDLYLINHGFEGFSHLFLAFYVICVVMRCALSQVMSVLFVCFFFFVFIYLVQTSWNYIFSHHASCVCRCVHREECYFVTSLC